ncbi:MAG: hypothetical protein P8Y74_12370 [Desulfobacterales bacterium]
MSLIICLISSVETMMSSAAIGYRTGDRHDSNKDLVGQRIGNVANKLTVNMALNLCTRLRLNTEEIKDLVEN